MRPLFQSILFLGLMLSMTLVDVFAQSHSHLTIAAAKGTGRTTGHIITLTVENNSDHPTRTQSQTIYFASNGRYQSYVGQVPEGIVIAPGQSRAVPIYGYCVQVDKPPVPDGEAIENISEAVEVAHPEGINLAVLEDPSKLEGMTQEPSQETPTVRVFKTQVLPQFTPKMIPELMGDSDPEEELQIEEDLVLTYPGTDIKIPSTIDIEKLPEIAIPLIVELVVDISHAVTVITNNPSLPTPFDFDPARKAQGQGQQTVWVATSPLSGIVYGEEEFKEKTYQQFEDNTGTDPETLAPEQKQQLDGGIGQFWTSFKAVGIEAKVFSDPSATVAYVADIDEGPDPVFQDRPCEWKKICVDFFLVGQQVGGEIDLGTAKFRYQGQLRQRPVRLAESQFQLAEGAIGIVSDEGMAGTLKENIKTVLEKVNSIYEPCCIWFELNEVYGVNPAKAKVGADGTTLKKWVKDGNVDELGDITSSRIIEEATNQVDDQDMNFNKAAQNFISRNNDVNSECLRIFIAPGIKIPGTVIAGGRAQTGGDHAFLSQNRLSPDDPGLGLAHEIGHNLGLDHVHGGVDEKKQANIMIDKIPTGHDLTGVKPVVDSKDQCDQIGARAETLGTNERPRTRASRRSPGSRPPQEGGLREEPAHDPGQPVAPPIDNNDDQEIQDQEEEEKCVCPTPETKVDGLDDLRDIDDNLTRRPILAEAQFKTCCAEIFLNVRAQKKGDSYEVSWEVDYEITDEKCFVDLQIDQFYSSKRYKYYVRGANTERVKSNFTKLVFKEVREGLARIGAGPKTFGLDGSARTNENNGESRGNLTKDPEGDHSLNLIKDCKKWSVLLGGTIKCKDGDTVKEFPFYLLFAKKEGSAPILKASPGNIESTDDKEFIRGNISKGTLYDHPN